MDGDDLFLFVLLFLVLMVFQGINELGEWAFGEGAEKRKRARERREHEERQEQWEAERAALRERFAEEAAQAKELRCIHASRELHAALEQIPTAPDYRRAAAVARRCSELPVSTRQYYFHQFRPLIEQHATACLQQRIDRKLLGQSLLDLVSALGVETFEAEYIILAAIQTIQNQVPLPRHVSFQDQVEEEVLLHRERVHAINRSLDCEEFREQLHEVERRRHEDILLRLTTDSGSQTRMITTL